MQCVNCLICVTHRSFYMKLINPNIGPSIKPLIMQGIQVGAHRQVPYRTTQHRKHFDNTKIFLITDTLQEKKTTI